jgi:YidC/Oxa1 family membrane protein insertase
MMEKRALLAVALSILVLIIYFHYFDSRQSALQPVTQTTTREKAEQAQPKSSTPETPVPYAPILPAAGDTKASAQTIEVAGSLYRAVVDNRGAVLTSWKLNDYKYYKDDKDKNGDIFEMVAGKRNGKDITYPASMIFSDEAITALANNEFYEVSVERGSGNGPYDLPATVVMTLKRQDLKIEKRFRFKKDNYTVDLSVICERSGKALEGRFFLGEDLGPKQEHFISSVDLKYVYNADGKTTHDTPPKNEKEVKKIYGNVRWVGLNMQYFAIIAIPDKPLPYFDIQKHSIKALGTGEKDRDLIIATTPVNGSLQYELYLGPKKQSNLQAVTSADITGVIDYGWFSVIVIPLLTALQWIHKYINNYGLAIVLLTLLLSLLVFPFRLKQMLSMKKMQVVQPKMKAIQEKYRRYKKTDPKRAEMNQEIMALYKEHGVNPLGGCIPMILQMPLLYAFYSLLAGSIELRQAPFLWLHDLSIKDPSYVLPIVMGITMFISQKITPMAPGTDPAQAKMMMVMPVVFTVMFFNVSSGLNLYFLCSNVFGIVLQKGFQGWTGNFSKIYEDGMAFFRSKFGSSPRGE